MTFQSILFNKNSAQRETARQPAFFTDLNLDQVIDAITARRQEYNLKPFFYTPLHDEETIRYRQAVMQDLENAPPMGSIKAFAEKMTIVRRYLALVEKLDFEYHKKGWFLEAALVYCNAVTELAANLSRANLRSPGLLAFREYLANYVRSPEFESLRAEVQAVKEGLRSVKYSVIIKSGKFSVRRYEEETDYSVEIEDVFEKFRQGTVKNYLVDVRERTGMNHIEAKILEFVARLFPEPFAALDRFCSRHNRFVDETIRTFDREIQFYVAYLEFIAEIRRKGLPFCYPQVSATSREVFVRDGFDLALAHALLHTETPVVCNDFFLQGPERIIVVSGPNQGGKTTFARMFGQLHYLASLGCPVPGRQARLFIPDQILTHFEREEDIRNLRGKLQDDLVRIHEIVAHATPDSVLILNEIFASTTLEDAVFLSKQIMARIMALDALCVWVTFIDELSRLSEKTVSMVSTVDPENPVIRTFKIVRRPADGLAYALSIAQKHHLTYEQIKERIQP
ncbi:DNA mismatch repair protein MutS [Candidatus Parcubacteria bacterium]|nr:MAG: DNA mismatch repair protein MutS [Candidatus Parcubacteria bacterium]